jgi:hypothetical protein
MTNAKEEWNVPSVEALTQADGIDGAEQVEFRNGLSGPVRR